MSPTEALIDTCNTPSSGAMMDATLRPDPGAALRSTSERPEPTGRCREGSGEAPRLAQREDGTRRLGALRQE